MSSAEQVRGLAQRMGGVIDTLLWTRGRYDLVRILDFLDDESFAAFALSFGSRGTVRTESLRAFTAEEMQRILQRMP